MDTLKEKWAQLDRNVRLVVIAVAAVVALLFVWKILPALIAAMGLTLFLVILFVPYWAPTIVAFIRKHPSKGGVLAVNFFFGWTFIGWVLALAWALSDNSGRQQTIIVNTAVATNVGAVPPPPVQQYQVGDVVNGHRFNGQSWVPATSDVQR
jgi:hypothetical protein